MRKITSELSRAFMNRESMKLGNTRTDGQTLYLHNNKIAEHRADGLYISNAGWASNTTKERLNGLNGVSISQKAFNWYLNGKEWGGEWVKVS